MELSNREKIVLHAVVQNFIDRAEPVGSALLSKLAVLNLSPASIRNIMADLEKKGYIYQPHISAGRIPTSLGYRVYVDELMKRARLTISEKELIFKALKEEGAKIELILQKASAILANITHQLTVLVAPGLDESTFEKIEIIPLSGNRILIVMSILSGFIKTINLEISEEINEKYLRKLTSILNERLSGLKVSVIREKFKEIVKDIPIDNYGIVNLFLRNPELVFRFQQDHELLFTGTSHLLSQPEFKNVDRVSDILGLIENKNPIVDLFDQAMNYTTISAISIGDEIPLSSMRDCSIVAARYSVGNVSGSIGIIGPMRMNYPKLLAVVDYTARTISSLLSDF